MLLQTVVILAKGLYQVLMVQYLRFKLRLVEAVMGLNSVLTKLYTSLYSRDEE